MPPNPPPKGRRWKGWPALAVGLLPLGPLVWAALHQRHGAEGIFSPGPLRTGHANLDCRHCHGEAWRGARKGIGADSLAADAMDRACADCHGGMPGGAARALPGALRAALFERPPVVGSHNLKQIPAELGHCADCHQEHGRGPATRAKDADCARCHADLRTHDASDTFARSVTAFDVDHPPFGQWRPGGMKDPGTIHFDHAAHLPLPAEVRGVDAAREGLQKRRCFFCHELEDDRRGFRPIRYAKHCAECHPLGVALQGATTTPHGEQAARAFRREPAPHVEPAAVRKALQTRLIGLVAECPELLDPEAPEPERRLPGKPRPLPVAWEYRPWVQNQLKEITGRLFESPAGCRYCHVEEVPGRRDQGLPRYRRTNLPTRWFPHGRYDHGRHDQLDCTSCHAAETSHRASDLLLPGIDRCLNCHNHRKDAVPHPRADCVECHRYHGGIE